MFLELLLIGSIATNAVNITVMYMMRSSSKPETVKKALIIHNKVKYSDTLKSNMSGHSRSKVTVEVNGKRIVDSEHRKDF